MSVRRYKKSEPSRNSRRRRHKPPAQYTQQQPDRRYRSNPTSSPDNVKPLPPGWPGQAFEFDQVGICFVRSLPAHFLGRTQPDAHFWPLRLPEQLAPIVRRQLDATHPGGFAVRHPRNRGRDRRRNATRAAAYPTVQRRSLVTACSSSAAPDSAPCP